MTLNLNKAIIAGNITRDIELRQTPSGISVASFSVAINRSKKGEDGNYIQETDFIDCQAWDKKAEFLGRNFRKGDPVCVVGSIRKRQWKSNDGTNRYATEVVAEDILFAGSKTPQEDTGTYSGANTQQQMQMPQEQPVAPPSYSNKSARFEELKIDEDLPF